MFWNIILLATGWKTFHIALSRDWGQSLDLPVAGSTMGNTMFTLSIRSQASSNSDEPDLMLKNTASDHGLHYLPLIQPLLDTSTGNEMVSQVL